MQARLAKSAVPLLITTTLAAAPAWAQNASPPQPAPAAPTGTGAEAPSAGTPGPMGHGPSGHRMAGRQHGMTMASQVEQRITQLHSRLQITSAQSQQWDQFAQAMRDNAKELDALYQKRSEELGSMSAVDNMRSFADIEQTRAQDMEKLVPTFQNLYASLSDQQKQAADEMFRNIGEQAQHRRQTSAR